MKDRRRVLGDALHPTPQAVPQVLVELPRGGLRRGLDEVALEASETSPQGPWKATQLEYSIKLNILHSYIIFFIILEIG